MDMLSRCLTTSLLLAASASIAFAQQPASRESLLSGQTASKPVLDAIDVYLNYKEKKIVGGKPAKAGQFPWQVALLVARVPDAYRAHFCGGSVHAERWIVTAAHCVNDTDAADIAIIAGTHELKDSSERVAVSRVLVHEDYDDESYDNDIALLELEKPLSLGERIRILPLLGTADESQALKPGALLTVSGWGRTQQDGEGTSALQYVNIPFVQRKTCNRALAYDGAVTERMICAGVAAGGKDSCQGDSGGPLAANATGAQPRLAGVVSWGEGCARPDKVGVYTRVSQFTGWVSTCMADPAACKAKR